MKKLSEAKTPQEFNEIAQENALTIYAIENKAYQYANGNGPPLNITEISTWIAIKGEKTG